VLRPSSTRKAVGRNQTPLLPERPSKRRSRGHRLGPGIDSQNPQRHADSPRRNQPPPQIRRLTSRWHLPDRQHVLSRSDIEPRPVVLQQSPDHLKELRHSIQAVTIRPSVASLDASRVPISADLIVRSRLSRSHRTDSCAADDCIQLIPDHPRPATHPESQLRCLPIAARSCDTTLVFRLVFEVVSCVTPRRVPDQLQDARDDFIRQFVPDVRQSSQSHRPLIADGSCSRRGWNHRRNHRTGNTRFSLCSPRLFQSCITHS